MHACKRPHSLVVRTSNCGRDNPGLVPGVVNVCKRVDYLWGLGLQGIRYCKIVWLSGLSALSGLSNFVWLCRLSGLSGLCGLFGRGVYAM